MLISTLFASALLMLGGFATEEASQDVKPSPEPSNPPPPEMTTYTPIELEQLCALKTNYCIYVDQVRPGTVHASPVNATDNQGGFLFEVAAYRDHPFHVCFGGCCIDLHSDYTPGCVRMVYVDRPSHTKGHLLARFADDVVNIVGPRTWMFREQVACEKESGGGLPYAVIGARSGQKNHAAKNDDQSSKDAPDAPAQTHPGHDSDDEHEKDPPKPSQQPPPSTQVLADSKLTDGAKTPHDYFDDPAVILPDD